MMYQPLVSVIIPNYNHARFLDERFLSVLNQTYQNFELIILDDKSTDSSVEIINKYKDNPHVSHVVINEENSGSPFKQWHKGFELAKGEWIWIAESDDSCEPDFLQNLVSSLVPDSAIVFCKSSCINQTCEKVDSSWQNVLTKGFVISGKDFLYRYLSYSCIIMNASSAIFNKHLAQEIPSDYMEYKGAGDWLFWIYLSTLGSVAFVPLSLNYYRIHEGNTTSKIANSEIGFRERYKICMFLKEHGYIPKSIYLRYRKRELYSFYFNTNLNGKLKLELLSLWNATFCEKMRMYTINKILYIGRLFHVKIS